MWGRCFLSTGGPCEDIDESVRVYQPAIGRCPPVVAAEATVVDIRLVEVWVTS